MKIYFPELEIEVEATITRDICPNHDNSTEVPGYGWTNPDGDEEFVCRVCFEDPRGRGSYQITGA